MKTIQHIVLGTSLLILPAGLGALERPEVGDPAPPLSLTSTEGATYSLAEESEAPRIVIFFRGSW
ncbi:MAG: hypothetical protein K8J08_21610 [Thermoanaerobaculia bacterium]|nr:hypothetical protein [Thermoanaerobaculia bacterium]